MPNAPFIKVEASKYTEVGYVGRDVDSMIRDLLDTAVAKVKAEQLEQLREQINHTVEEKLLDLLLPRSRPRRRAADHAEDEALTPAKENGLGKKSPFTREVP